VAAGPGGVGQQRHELQHPAVDGDVVDLDPAFGEQLLDVAIRQRKRRYRRTVSTMTSGGKQDPANADRAIGVGPRRRVVMATVRGPWLTHSRCNSAHHTTMTEPWGRATDAAACWLPI
jgi:hypothetical protein